MSAEPLSDDSHAEFDDVAVAMPSHRLALRAIQKPKGRLNRLNNASKPDDLPGFTDHSESNEQPDLKDEAAHNAHLHAGEEPNPVKLSPGEELAADTQPTTAKQAAEEQSPSQNAPASEEKPEESQDDLRGAPQETYNGASRDEAAPLLSQPLVHNTIKKCKDKKRPGKTARAKARAKEALSQSDLPEDFLGPAVSIGKPEAASQVKLNPTSANKKQKPAQNKSKKQKKTGATPLLPTAARQPVADNQKQSVASGKTDSQLDSKASDISSLPGEDGQYAAAASAAAEEEDDWTMVVGNRHHNNVRGVSAGLQSKANIRSSELIGFKASGMAINISMSSSSSEIDAASPASSNGDIPAVLRTKPPVRTALPLTKLSVGGLFTKAFPHGYDRVLTSGKGLLCGLGAVTQSMKAQFAHLPIPTENELSAVLKSEGWINHVKAFSADGGLDLTNAKNLTFDQVAGVLYMWGRVRNLSLQMGVKYKGNKPMLFPIPSEADGHLDLQQQRAAGR